MLSREIAVLEQENQALKVMLKELEVKMRNEEEGKPKACKYCKNYIQHYGKFGNRFSPINAGHCVSGVPACKGGKKKPAPDDSCPYFEMGVYVG